MEQQAEESALNEAAREQNIQVLIKSRVAAEVAEALGQQAETTQSPARQSSDGSWREREVDPNSFIAKELKRTQIKLKQEQAARAKLQEVVTAAGVDDKGKLRGDDDMYSTPVFQQVYT